MADGTTTVYQYFASSGALIYVGVTDRGVRRLHEHAESKPWWNFATGCTLEHYETRDDALAREKELIERFRPPFNHQHNPERAIPIEQRVRSRLPNVTPVLARRAQNPLAPTRCSKCASRPAIRGKRLCLVCIQEARSATPGRAISRATPASQNALLACSTCGELARLSPRDLCRSCEGKQARQANRKVS